MKTSLSILVLLTTLFGASALQRWELISKGPEDTNPIYRQNHCLPQPDNLQLTLPHTSITLLELKLK